MPGAYDPSTGFYNPSWNQGQQGVVNPNPNIVPVPLGGLDDIPGGN
jgi:hypothetical protein